MIRGTFEDEEDEESKIVACLGGVTDVVEEAEPIVGAWNVNVSSEWGACIEQTNGGNSSYWP